jgi:hypothetical protein
VDFSNISRCYGWAKVNGSKGLLFDRIVDSDGYDSITFKKAIEDKIIDISYARELLNILKNYLQKNAIVFVDVGFNNIMCQKQKDGTYKLIIIDGLGGRRPRVKFWFYRHCKLYTKYKIQSQWKKVLDNFNKLDIA